MSFQFFKETEIEDISEFCCINCPLGAASNIKRIELYGEGRKKIMVVGEAPGFSEDCTGIPFSGMSGDLLWSILGKVGIDLEKDCWVTNAVNCRPINNRDPSNKELDRCRPILTDRIKKTNPNLIIPVGKIAVKTIFQDLMEEEIHSIGKWVGKCVPLRKPNAWVCPTYHPSYLLREDSKTLNLITQEHFEKALRLSEKKPWPNEISSKSHLPIEAKEVTILENPNKIIKILQKFCDIKKEVAFDYETTSIRPYGKGQKVVSIGISDGKKTFAFKVSTKIMKSWRKFLSSSTPKIGANQNFEEHWSVHFFGCGVNNWVWDTIIAAHYLDNTPKTTSVKFQTLLRFGVFDYNKHVKSYLESKGGVNVKNKIEKLLEINPTEVLVYNGLDALFEYKIAKQQMQEYFEREKELKSLGAKRKRMCGVISGV